MLYALYMYVLQYNLSTCKIWYYRATSKKKGIIRDYQLNAQVYKEAFIGSAFVDWLTNQEHIGIEDAVDLGRKLLDYNIIKHGKWQIYFIVSDIFYNVYAGLPSADHIPQMAFLVRKNLRYRTANSTERARKMYTCQNFVK